MRRRGAPAPGSRFRPTFRAPVKSGVAPLRHPPRPFLYQRPIPSTPSTRHGPPQPRIGMVRGHRMPNRPWTIAVVDDDPSMCSALARLLTAWSFSVRTFPSAEAFLGDPRRREVDFLVLDVQLGVTSGLELQRRLADAPPVPPIAFITAHDDPESREQAQRARCVAYLRKPFPGRQLAEAIHRSLDTPEDLPVVPGNPDDRIRP